jgi:hypothetical protein
MHQLDGLQQLLAPASAAGDVGTFGGYGTKAGASSGIHSHLLAAGYLCATDPSAWEVLSTVRLRLLGSGIGATGTGQAAAAITQSVVPSFLMLGTSQPPLLLLPPQATASSNDPSALSALHISTGPVAPDLKHEDLWSTDRSPGSDGLSWRILSVPRAINSSTLSSATGQGSLATSSSFWARVRQVLLPAGIAAAAGAVLVLLLVAGGYACSKSVRARQQVAAADCTAKHLQGCRGNGSSQTSSSSPSNANLGMLLAGQVVVQPKVHADRAMVPPSHTAVHPWSPPKVHTARLMHVPHQASSIAQSGNSSRVSSTAKGCTSSLATKSLPLPARAHQPLLLPVDQELAAAEHSFRYVAQLAAQQYRGPGGHQGSAHRHEQVGGMQRETPQGWQQGLQTTGEVDNDQWESLSLPPQSGGLYEQLTCSRTAAGVTDGEQPAEDSFSDLTTLSALRLASFYAQAAAPHSSSGGEAGKVVSPSGGGAEGRGRGSSGGGANPLFSWHRNNLFERQGSTCDRQGTTGCLEEAVALPVPVASAATAVGGHNPGMQETVKHVSMAAHSAGQPRQHAGEGPQRACEAGISNCVTPSPPLAATTTTTTTSVAVVPEPGHPLQPPPAEPPQSSELTAGNPDRASRETGSDEGLLRSELLKLQQLVVHQQRLLRVQESIMSHHLVMQREYEDHQVQQAVHGMMGGGTNTRGNTPTISPGDGAEGSSSSRGATVAGALHVESFYHQVATSAAIWTTGQRRFDQVAGTTAAADGPRQSHTAAPSATQQVLQPWQFMRQGHKRGYATQDAANSMLYSGTKAGT